MPVRHFYLLSHYICYSLFFLFSACWLQRNERNSLWENKGERSDVYCLLGRYLCHGILFTCSHITFVMVYYFYFRLFSLMNQIVNYICSGHSIPNKSNADLMTLIVTSTTFNLAIFTFSSSTLIWQS